MGKIEDSIKQLNEVKSLAPNMIYREAKQATNNMVESYIKRVPSYIEADFLAECHKRLQDEMNSLDNPLPDMIESIMKSNQESAEQIKILNETNNRQQQELKKLNNTVQNLQERLQNLENSHKYDTLKTIAFSLISAILGAGATMFVPWAVNWIIKIIS